MGAPHHVVELERAEAMRLLASVTYGRVVFAANALPAIRPVNHIVDGDKVVLRTRVTADFSRDVVVAYQADQLDPRRQVGWSVVVTGWATTVTDAEDVARYEEILDPWVNEADTVLAIKTQMVSGMRIVKLDTSER